MKNIYLTSPLQKEGLYHIPMIKFTTTASQLNLEGIDTLMFTSKQAVVTANSIDKRWQKIPSLAIGSATAKKITELGGKVLYHPKNFYGKELSKDIAKMFANKDILYLRPQEVSFDSKRFLQQNGISIKEQIIYKTTCKKYSIDKAPLNDSIIIFTSPSTIHCFLKNFKWHKSYIAIVIGKATLEHLPKDANFSIADTPTIDACIKKALEIR